MKQQMLPPVKDEFDTSDLAPAQTKKLTLSDLDITVEDEGTDAVLQRPRQDVGH